MAGSAKIQIDKDLSFQISYNMSLYLKGLQKYCLSEFKIFNHHVFVLEKEALKLWQTLPLRDGDM